MSKPVITLKGVNLDELKKDIIEKRDTWRKQTKTLQGRWVESLAFYVGKQYTLWDDTSNKLTFKKPATDKSIRLTFNYVLSKCRTMLSKMTSSTPTAEVLPASTDDEDVRSSESGTSVLSHNHRVYKYQRTYRDFALAMICFGQSWIKTVWDPTYGKKYVKFKEQPVMREVIGPLTNPDGTPQLDEAGNPITGPQIGEDGQPMMEPEIEDLSGEPKMEPVLRRGKPVVEAEWYEGRPKKTAVNPLNMLYDRTIADWEEVPECMEQNVVTRAWCKKYLPGCDAIKGDANGSDDLYHQVLTSGGENIENNEERVWVFEYWTKATDDFPQGARVILVNDEIVVATPMPTLEGDELPYDEGKFLSIPGSSVGIGLPEILTEPQQAINKIISQIVENANDVLNIKLLRNVLTEILTPITDAAGQHVVYRGVKPEYMTPPTIPPSLFQLVSTMKTILDDLSGIHTVSEGGSDPSFNSGDQVEAQGENDRMKFTTTIDDMLMAITGSCRKELMYFQSEASMPMKVKILGKSRKYTIRDIQGSDIRNNFDVFINPASMMNQSRSSMRNEILKVIESPAIKLMAEKNPKEAMTFVMSSLRHLHWGEAEKFYDTLDPHSQKAEREHADIAAGGQAFVLPFQDHAIHLLKHEEWMNSAEFDELSETAKQNAIKHWNETKDIINRINAPEPVQQPLAPQPGQQSAPPAEQPAAPQGVMP